MSQKTGRNSTTVRQDSVLGKMSKEALLEEHLNLKERLLEQKRIAAEKDTNMKKMATKLLRLTADLKKRTEGVGGRQPRKRDVETEELLEDYRIQIRDLGLQNEKLKQKLVLTRQSGMPVTIKSHRPRHLPASGQNSSFQRSNSRPRTTGANIGTSPVVDDKSTIACDSEVIMLDVSTVSVQTSPMPQVQLPPTPKDERPQYQAVVGALRNEQSRLQTQVKGAKGRLGEAQAHVAALQQQLREQQEIHLRELAEFENAKSEAQKSSIQEDIELIRLQRDVKDKTNKLHILQKEYAALEEHISVIKSSHAAVLSQMDTLHNELRDERDHSASLASELKVHSAAANSARELQEIISDLRGEKTLLEQQNQNLISTAFSGEYVSDQRHAEEVADLKCQISRIEANIRADLEEKQNIIQQLEISRNQEATLEDEKGLLEVSLAELRETHESVLEKMKFFSQDSAVDLREIEEALTIIKTRKAKGYSRVSFLQAIDDDDDDDNNIKATRKQVQDLMVDRQDAIQELEKTRKLLSIQHNLNKDYKREVDAAHEETAHLRMEYQLRMDEDARLLDIRGAKIYKLEQRLKDIVYGTRKVQIETSTEDTMGEAVELGRGQNLLEINISDVELYRAGLSFFEGSEPRTFITYDFYDFDTQVSPVISGSKPIFDSTAQFVVNVDDFLLGYLRKDYMTIELHMANGTEYSTIGTARMNFREVSERVGKLHRKVDFMSVVTSMDTSGLSKEERFPVATLSYWLSMRLPVAQALRLYKERQRALGVLNTLELSSPDNYDALDVTARDVCSTNELVITVHSCTGLRGRVHNHRPSPYVIYQLQHFPPHPTRVANNNNSPIYDDSHSYTLPMSRELKAFFQTGGIEFFVFDDDDDYDIDELESLDDECASDTNNDRNERRKAEDKSKSEYQDRSGEYLGSVFVPLAALVDSNKVDDTSLNGIWDLGTPSGRVNGSIQLSLFWKRPFHIEEDKARSRPSSVASSSKPPKGIHFSKKASGDSENRVSSQQQNNDIRATQEMQPTSTQNDVDDAVISPALPETAVPIATKLSMNSLDNRMSDTNVPKARRSGRPEIIPNGHSEDDDVVTGGGIDDATDEDDRVDMNEIKNDQDSLAKVPSTRVPSNRHVSSVSSSITVSIDYFQALPAATYLSDPTVHRCFVSFQLLDIEPESTETHSLPKAKALVPLRYDFSRSFPLNENTSTREHLTQALRSDSDDTQLIFSIVSEPLEDDLDSECEDLGVCVVNLRDILLNRRDVINADLQVMDAVNTHVAIGVLRVSVKAIAALLDVQKNLNI